MLSSHPLRLRLAVDRMSVAGEDHYAIWALESPYPGGYGHHDCLWDETLSQLWQNWQQFFSLRGLPQVPHVPSAYIPQFVLDEALDSMVPPTGPGAGQPGGYTGRLMQGLGVALWQWLFSGVIQQSLERSMGIAMGQEKPLRLRLELRDPNLIGLPWEIMQSQPGRQAISLNQQVLFSRTTSAVDPLPSLELDNSLRVLLVLGQDEVQRTAAAADSSDRQRQPVLQLHEEAQVLKNLLEQGISRVRQGAIDRVVCQVTPLLEPDAAAVMDALGTGYYNVFFYAGHGVPAPDGGLLFLRPGATMNGTELAQVLTRQRIKLAVFNTCWGAQPDQRQQQTIPRSSLAEVMLHHGVPAVLAMRDSIADEEALSFIQVFAQSLAERQPIEQAVAIARQHLLTLYKFNQPAWTLPVLYMHPDYDGEILEPARQDVTRLPGEETGRTQIAAIRSVDDPAKVWPLFGGMMRVGRLPDNDLVISEPWVSGQHAEIFARHQLTAGKPQVTYYLKDVSRFGTYYYQAGAWHHVHREEVPLPLGTQLRFGSLEGRLLELVSEGNLPSARV
jgi:hypothetical protein